MKISNPGLHSLFVNSNLKYNTVQHCLHILVHGYMRYIIFN